MTGNPFPGLRPFGASEAHLFFGREEHTEALLLKLGTERLSAVVGICGSGKSSLVFAGILPRLRRGYRPRGGPADEARSSWRIATMRPGDTPMLHLAQALLRAQKDEEDTEPQRASDAEQDDALDGDLLQAQLQRSQRGLIDACQSLGLGPNENLLLIVDQFEELFRYRQWTRRTDRVKDPAAAFVQLLLRASSQREVPIYVMLTMRSDFLGECVEFSGLPEAINDGQFLVPLLRREQRERAIRGPMAVAGASISPALVQRLLNDAGDAGDQLPVLQHALMRSFDVWQSDPNPASELGLEHYQRAGGMSAALAKHADEALQDAEQDLGEAGLRTSERLFRALTERGAQGRSVRRPCRVSEILAIADTDLDTLSRVVAHFIGERRGFLVLQPTNQVLSDNSLLDISHEALMRIWPRLQQWTAEEFAFANQLQYLNDAEQKHERGLAGLWRDPELSLALEWIERARPTPAAVRRYGVDLGRLEAFLQASVEARKEALKAAQDARIVQRFRKLFGEARRSTLLALLAVPIFLVLQGSGVLDGMLPFDTRLKFLSVSARQFDSQRALERAVADRLETVVIDEKTEAAIRDQRRLGERFGDSGATWRMLWAEALTRLTDAHAKVVVLVSMFDENKGTSELVRAGTDALANAILHARSQGTAVVVSESTTTSPASYKPEPKIAEALRARGPADSTFAPGYYANHCLGVERSGAAVFVTALTQRPDRSSRPSLAVAALQSLWEAPGVAVDGPHRTFFLSGSGPQHELGFAGFARRLTEPAGCGSMTTGDEPGLQFVELSSTPVQRGVSEVMPFEDVLQRSQSLDVAGKIVMVGSQIANPLEVVECSAPWSCAKSQRFSLAIQVDSLKSLLRGRAIRPISPALQLLLMLGLCALVAWLRLRNHDRSPWVRRGSLAGLMLLDLAIVVVSAVFFDVLMDELYHLCAMLATYLVVARLDKGTAVRAMERSG